jgi:hypothetical protein
MIIITKDGGQSSDIQNVNITYPTAIITLIFAILSTLTVISAKKLKNKIDSFYITDQKMEHIRNALNQIAFITDADRVTLGVFHGGNRGVDSTHYTKMRIISSYCSPNVPELLEKTGEDIKAEILIPELRPLVNSGGDLFLSVDEVPEDCRQYMKRRGVKNLWNRMIYCGGSETAVISLHWCKDYDRLPIPPEKTRGHERLGDLFNKLEFLLNSIRRY